MSDHVREQAFNLLLKNQTEGTFSSSLLRDAYDRFAADSAAQRSFLKALTESVLEHRLLADEIIRARSGRPPEKLRPKIRLILEMGICQLLYMDGVPDHAAVNESVQLARKNGLSALTGFVNGVLRGVIRDRDSGSLSAWMESLPAAVRFSIPDWLCEMWTDTYGKEETVRLLKAFEERKEVTIRLDERMSAAEQEALTDRIRGAGARVREGVILPYVRRISGSGDVRKLPGFAEGKIFIQDESAMLAAEAAEIRGGEKILDVCAAPGGKTTHAAVKAGPDGHVTACDIREEKLPRIRENAERLGLGNITVLCRDAAVREKAFEDAFDIVFCDLPCSGLGIIGRKHDIRYRVKPEDITALSALQRKILRNAAAYVKPGGQMIYSTCTVSRRENEENARFIEDELGLEPAPLPPVFAPLMPANEKTRHSIQLLPHIHGTDGFYISRFARPARQTEQETEQETGQENG